MSVTGNANVGNISAATGVFTANISVTGNVTTSNLTVSKLTNLGSNANVTITGGSSGQYLQTNGSGSLSWVSPSVGTSLINGSSSFDIAVSGGNISANVGGVTNVLVLTTSGANISGTANVTGNANVGNIGATNAVISATLTAANVNVSSGVLTVTGNANVGNIGVTGGVFTGNINASNLTITKTANLGSNANVTITGGSSGQYLQTNGSGALSWVSPGVSTSLVNGSSSFGIALSGGNITANVGGATNVLVLTTTGANIAGTANITGNANVGNIGVVGNINTSNLTVSGITNLGSNANVTITGGSSGQYLQTNGSGALSWSTVTVSATPWTYQNANFSATAGSKYFISGTSITATLPASPSNNDTIVFVNVNSSVTGFTVARNGKTIMGDASDLAIDLTNFSVTLVYYATNGDWRLA